jgi:hypothetical protein
VESRPENEHLEDINNINNINNGVFSSVAMSNSFDKRRLAILKV